MKQHTLPAHDLQEREIEGETPPGQEGEGMAPPPTAQGATRTGHTGDRGGEPPNLERKEEVGEDPDGEADEGQDGQEGQ